MADYKHGSMDIEDHVRTFNGLVKAARYVVTAVVIILIFMAFMDS